MNTCVSRQPGIMRKPARQRRSRVMVDTIIDAGIRVLGTRGWADFTTNEVAAVAGISVGSLSSIPAHARLTTTCCKCGNRSVTVRALLPNCGKSSAHCRALISAQAPAALTTCGARTARRKFRLALGHFQLAGRHKAGVVTGQFGESEPQVTRSQRQRNLGVVTPERTHATCVNTRCMTAAHVALQHDHVGTALCQMQCARQAMHWRGLQSRYETDALFASHGADAS